MRRIKSIYVKIKIKKAQPKNPRVVSASKLYKINHRRERESYLEEVKIYYPLKYTHSPNT